MFCQALVIKAKHRLLSTYQRLLSKKKVGELYLVQYRG
jgi:hypothetical protein